jgi:glycosyltransferase involved in cell wall biosynthesis
MFVRQDSLPRGGRPIISIVVPCFGDVGVIEEFHRRLCTVMAELRQPWEVVYVNDRSHDDALRHLEELYRKGCRIVLVNLSRNFGKEIALTAGLIRATGEAIVVIAADLRDPPELIPNLVAAWRQGFDIVCAQRLIGSAETGLETTSFRQKLSGCSGPSLPSKSCDFRLMSRVAVDGSMRSDEQHWCKTTLSVESRYASKTIHYDLERQGSGKARRPPRVEEPRRRRSRRSCRRIVDGGDLCRLDDGRDCYGLRWCHFQSRHYIWRHRPQPPSCHFSRSLHNWNPTDDIGRHRGNILDWYSKSTAIELTRRDRAMVAPQQTFRRGSSYYLLPWAISGSAALAASNSTNRSNALLNPTQCPNDVIAIAVLWRLCHKLRAKRPLLSNTRVRWHLNTGQRAHDSPHFSSAHPLRRFAPIS